MSQDVELKRLLEAAKPEDVTLHIKLLHCYLNLKWIRYAYFYAIQALEQHVFDESLDWYICLKKLFKLYEDDEEYVKDRKFYMHYMLIMERLMYLLLEEQSLVRIGANMKDNVEALFSFGEVLQRSSKLTVSPSDLVFHEVLQEMNSKFCLYLYTIVTAEEKDVWATYETYEREPDSLQRCASRIVGTVIAKSVLDIFISVRRIQPEDFTDEKRRNLESLIIRASEFFDSVIPTTLHMSVTRESLFCLPDDIWKFVDSCEIKLNYLDIIFRSRKHITGLTVYNYIPSIESVMFSSLHRLKNLEYLCLNSCGLHKNFDHYSKVTRAIKDMKSLASFKSIYCNDEIVKVLGNNNYALKNLKLSEGMCETDVTDSSVPYLLNLKNLEELDIYYCHISTESQIQLLSGLPHLKAIAAHKLNKFLAQLNDDSVQLPYQFVRYYCESVEDIVNLTKYCPLITKLTLESDSDTLAFCDITSLAALSHLNIFYCDISLNYSNLKPFLELKGHDLIKLRARLMDISSVTETQNEINHLYPNLKEVTICNWKYCY